MIYSAPSPRGAAGDAVVAQVRLALPRRRRAPADWLPAADGVGRALRPAAREQVVQLVRSGLGDGLPELAQQRALALRRRRLRRDLVRDGGRGGVRAPL